MAIPLAERFAAHSPYPPFVFNYDSGLPKESLYRESATDTMLMGLQVLKEAGIWEELSDKKNYYFGKAAKMKIVAFVSPQADTPVPMADGNIFIYTHPPKVLSGYAFSWKGETYDPAAAGKQAAYEHGFYIADGTILTPFMGRSSNGIPVNPEFIYDSIYAEINNPLYDASAGGMVNINIASYKKPTSQMPRGAIINGIMHLPLRENSYPTIKNWVSEQTRGRFHNKSPMQQSALTLLDIASIVTDIFSARKTA
ncbi:hypothetical protein BH11PAT1_BH11PAT1_3280 [soil metagenome]